MPVPMKKKQQKTRVKKSKTNKNLVLYVEDCTLKGKVFSDSKSLASFVKAFNKKYPSNTNAYQDNWLDLVVTDIKGEITVMDAGLEIAE